MASSSVVSTRLLLYGGDDDDVAFKKVAKVKLVEMHPVHPWVACADERGLVTVWDVERREPLLRATAAALAERGPAAAARAPGGRASAKVGEVRQLRFYDAHVLLWLGNCPPQPPTASWAPPAWLVVVCEHRATLVGPRTGACRHASADALGWGAGGPTCVEPLSSRLLAVGCHDGAVRLWDWRRNATAATLYAPGSRDAFGAGEVSWLASARSHAAATHFDPAEWTRARADESAGARLVAVWAGDGAVALWTLDLVGNIAMVVGDGARPPVVLGAREKGKAGGFVRVARLAGPGRDARAKGGNAPLEVSLDRASLRLAIFCADGRVTTWDLRNVDDFMPPGSPGTPPAARERAGSHDSFDSSDSGPGSGGAGSTGSGGGGSGPPSAQRSRTNSGDARTSRSRTFSATGSVDLNGGAGGPSYVDAAARVRVPALAGDKATCAVAAHHPRWPHASTFLVCAKGATLAVMTQPSADLGAGSLSEKELRPVGCVDLHELPPWRPLAPREPKWLAPPDAPPPDDASESMSRFSAAECAPTLTLALWPYST